LKLIYENPNQFFHFIPKFVDKKKNIKYSELSIVWTPIITKYVYRNNPKSLIAKNDFASDYKDYTDEKAFLKHFGQTMLSYDKRIPYGCQNRGYPQNTFTTDLALGISSDKYKLEKQYVKYLQTEVHQKVYLYVQTRMVVV
jgi:hypothetical protein